MHASNGFLVIGQGRHASHVGSGLPPSVFALQEALQQARTLTSISADGLMAGGGSAAPGLDPQSSYGSYGGDGGFGAADALAVLGRMQSAGSLTGADSHVLRSPRRGSQYMQHSSVQSAFGSAAAQQLHAIGSASRPLSAETLGMRRLPTPAL